MFRLIQFFHSNRNPIRTLILSTYKCIMILFLTSQNRMFDDWKIHNKNDFCQFSCNNFNFYSINLNILYEDIYNILLYIISYIHYIYVWLYYRNIIIFNYKIEWINNSWLKLYKSHFCYVFLNLKYLENIFHLVDLNWIYLWYIIHS